LVGAQKSGDVLDRVACAIFEIVLATDTKLRLKEKFGNVVSLLRTMFNAQSDIIMKQERTLELCRSDLGRQKISLEESEGKVRDFTQKIYFTEESSLVCAKKAQINEIKVCELEKRLEENLFKYKFAPKIYFI
jgi:hypothetical protein